VRGARIGRAIMQKNWLNAYDQIGMSGRIIALGASGPNLL